MLATGRAHRHSIAITFVLPLLRFISEAEREGRPRVEERGRGRGRGDVLLFSLPLSTSRDISLLDFERFFIHHRETKKQRIVLLVRTLNSVFYNVV